MPPRRPVLHLLLAATLLATIAALPACEAEPGAPSLASGSVAAYVGHWIVEDPMTAPLPLGLRIARAGEGVVAQVTYSGVLYEATGRVERGVLVLQRPRPEIGAVTHLRAVLRRDGRLGVTLETIGPAVDEVPMEFVLRRD